MPTGGAEQAIGDGAALMGADPAVEIRRAILAAFRHATPDAAAAQMMLDAAVAVAVERESRAREVRDEALAREQARTWQLELRIEKALERIEDGEDTAFVRAALEGRDSDAQ